MTYYLFFLIYVGAGTSARIGVQDGVELTPTFNWPEERTLYLIAGGDDALMRSVEGAEDRIDSGRLRLMQHRRLTSRSAWLTA